jgi:hypothetical protein
MDHTGTKTRTGLHTGLACLHREFFSFLFPSLLLRKSAVPPHRSGTRPRYGTTTGGGTITPTLRGPDVATTSSGGTPMLQLPPRHSQPHYPTSLSLTVPPQTSAELPAAQVSFTNSIFCVRLTLLHSVDTSVFGFSSGDIFTVDNFAKRALIISSVAAAIGSSSTSGSYSHTRAPTCAKSR